MLFVEEIFLLRDDSITREATPEIPVNTVLRSPLFQKLRNPSEKNGGRTLIKRLDVAGNENRRIVARFKNSEGNTAPGSPGRI